MHTQIYIYAYVYVYTYAYLTIHKNTHIYLDIYMPIHLYMRTHNTYIANLRYPAKKINSLLVSVDIPIDTKRLKDESIHLRLT